MSSYILTISGRKIDPLNPNPDHITIHDIAHALALINRWTGHTSFPMSVGQHSLIVCRNLPERYQLEGLLHDASEAFLTDINRPLKKELREYDQIESNLQRIIAKKFKLIYPWPENVKIADDRALVTEVRDCMPSDISDFHPCFSNVEPYPEQIHEVPWKVVERQFIQKFKSLYNKRG